MSALSAPQLVLEVVIIGTDQPPARIFVPAGWSGKVGVHVNVHRGHPSRRYQVVKEELVDPTQERAPS